MSGVSVTLGLGGAPQAEILRSNQKDQYYETVLKGQLEEVFLATRPLLLSLLQHLRLHGDHLIEGDQDTLSPWQLWQQRMRSVGSHLLSSKYQSSLLSVAAALLYHFLTTARSHSIASSSSCSSSSSPWGYHQGQSLGEEYCDIRPVSSSSSSSVSLAQSSLFILLHRVLPALAPLLPQLLLPPASPNSSSNSSSSPNRPSHVIAAKIPALLRLAREFVLPLHLAIFYFAGKYLHLSKRVAGISYIFTRNLRPGEERPAYSLLGVLIVLQVLAKALSLVRAQISSPASSDAPSEM